MTKRSEKLVLPVISIVLGFLVGTVIIVATGRSVSGMFTALFKSFTGIDLSGGQAFNPRYIGEVRLFRQCLLFSLDCPLPLQPEQVCFALELKVNSW